MEKYTTEPEDKAQSAAEKSIPEVPHAPIGAEPVGQPATAPSLEDMKCRMGPCRYYWHLVTSFPDGNPVGVLDHAPKSHHHTCIRNPGMETSFQDDAAFECNLWDPLTSKELKQLDLRRDDYERRAKKEKK